MNRKFDITAPLVFPKGLYDLNEEEHFDYQLNRIINWNGGDAQEIRSVSHLIENFGDWKRVLLTIAKKAEEEGRTENAIAYYRMAEFYIPWTDPDALPTYLHAREMFYEYYADCFEAHDGKAMVERKEVPFESYRMPVMHFIPENEPKGVFVFHGGYDSYMEEFMKPMLYLRQKGYDVYMFEGPGQGAMLRLQNCPLTWEWEKPVKALLDYFDLQDVTLCGCSLGGYYAPRAAAFEKRIRRVIAWSVFPSVFANIEEGTVRGASFLLGAIKKVRLGKAADSLIDRMAAKGDLSMIAMQDAKHKAGVTTYDELYEKVRKIDLEPVAEFIDQDVLLVGASEDTICSNRTLGRQVNMLTNARSVTYRMITRKEEGSNHCNCGNTKLALDVMCQWMRDLDELGY